MRKLVLAVTLVVGTHAAGPTLASAPPSDVLQGIADAVGDTTLDELVLFAPNSAAFVYFQGLFLLTEFDALGMHSGTSSVAVSGNTVVVVDDGLTFDNVQLDAEGLVVDLNRNGVPLSNLVYPIGQIVEAEGVTGTIHSIRYFDGSLQVLTLIENNGTAEAHISSEEFISEGQHLVNLFVSPAGPTVVNANLDVFDAASTTGGTIYGQLWVGNTGVVEFEIPVPPLGSPQPAHAALRQPSVDRRLSGTIREL